MKDESARFLGNLDCVESFRIRGNSTHRRSYMDGKLYADVKAVFDKEMPRKNMFGELTVSSNAWYPSNTFSSSNSSSIGNGCFSIVCVTVLG